MCVIYFVLTFDLIVLMISSAVYFKTATVSANASYYPMLCNTNTVNSSILILEGTHYLNCLEVTLVLPRF